MKVRRSRRALLVVSAAFVLLGALASLTAAAPIYTAWSTPVNVGPVVNSSANEAGPALSGDGLSLYFYSTRPGGLGDNDIWVSQRATTSDPWGAPVNLGAPINSTATDFVPSFSSDGHWMFFASARTGGFGGADLYQSYRADVHNDFGWQTPTNLGPNVNTTAAENGNGFFANGGSPQLFFGSDRLGPTGNSDLYMSQQQPDGTWGLATRIPELSTSFAENRPTLRQDGLEIFFYSNRTGTVGGNDLWTATRASLDDAWSTPVDLGVPVNSSGTEIHPYLSADATTIVFSSDRTGGSGSTDLYVITRAQIFPATKDECKDGGFERFGIFTNQGDCVSYVATKGTNGPG
jgi:Tol biopolymer transport system component